jgi:hypothetical protein
METFPIIIGKYFDGDTDEKLKILQHGSYYDLLREWINRAGTRRLRYRASPEWAEVTQMWERFREEGVYDHRTIQMPYDLIAARFRQVAQELSMPESEKEDEWHAFFINESKAWLEHDVFLRCFMITLSAKNSTVGYEAEGAMFQMMTRQYEIKKSVAV